MRSVLSLAVLVLAACLSGNTLAKEQLDNETLEAVGSMLSLPATADGVLVISCTQCKAFSIQAGASTRYFIAERPVLLAQFADYLRTHGKEGVGVSYNTKAKVLNSIRVYPRH